MMCVCQLPPCCRWSSNSALRDSVAGLAGHSSRSEIRRDVVAASGQEWQTSQRKVEAGRPVAAASPYCSRAHLGDILLLGVVGWQGCLEGAVDCLRAIKKVCDPLTNLCHVALEEARHPFDDFALAIFFSEGAEMRLEEIGGHVRILMQGTPERFEVVRILRYTEAQVELVRPGERGLRRVAMEFAAKRLWHG